MKKVWLSLQERPPPALQALRAELAQPGLPDIAANEAALRTLCIRAELFTDTPTPAEDAAFRRDFQLQQLLKGFGQARAAGNAREAVGHFTNGIKPSATTDVGLSRPKIVRSRMSPR